MINTKNIKFTRQGYDDVKNEYENLKKEREEAVKELSFARDMGDRSENAAYKTARSKLSSIDNRLKRLAVLVKFGKVIDNSGKNTVDIGATVVVDDGGGPRELIIVSGFESDLAKGKISNISPLGRSLIGKRTGEAATIKVPAGIISYKIISVSY